MKYVICASPLVRMYLPEHHDALMENPDLVFDHTAQFSFTINRGCSGFRVDFNKPMIVTGRDDQEIEALYLWLTGELGHSAHETDIYGLVPFDPARETAGLAVDLSKYEDELLSEDPETVKKAQKKVIELRTTVSQRKKQLAEVFQLESEARIKKGMRIVHNNLIRQWQINEEMKLGKHQPSTSEMLGAHALDAELKNAEKKGAPLKNRMNQLMGNVVT